MPFQSSTLVLVLRTHAAYSCCVLMMCAHDVCSAHTKWIASCFVFDSPSQMTVVGASEHFDYGRAPGSSGCFLARLHHASVAPRVGASPCTKVAFFFKKSDKGERRAKRGLASVNDAERELARRRQHVVAEVNEFGFEAAHAPATGR